MKFIHQDEGFRVLRHLKGSPHYFQNCKKDLFAVLYHLGNPTLFFSLSAAETRWSHLLKVLDRLAEKKDYTDYEIDNKTWQQNSKGPCKLIANQPVIHLQFCGDSTAIQWNIIKKEQGGMEWVTYSQPAAHSCKFYVKNLP